ncbi:unnamed protein product [Prunus armeniaca]
MKSKSTVLPVFYHVDPSDLRKQTGSFACAFAEHEERFREDIERVKSWRAALIEVANLSGFDSKNECERKLIENIVEWVWEKVHHRFKLLDSKGLVGMKFIREQVDLLLAHPTDDVRFIGIWGMGGIGKTTIAHLVYDSISTRFEVSSFLANVREVSQRGNLVHLQRQLLSPILKDQITQVWDEQCTQVCDEQCTQVWDEQWETSVIKNCLYNKKVLLILDDGMSKERVIEILDCCGLCGHIGINALVQKSLLTMDISNNTVEMHDLIQEMALEIVRRECSEEPGRRSRLCNCDDISHVFINNTATYKIKGIALRMARL